MTVILTIIASVRTSLLRYFPPPTCLSLSLPPASRLLRRDQKYIHTRSLCLHHRRPPDIFLPPQTRRAQKAGRTPLESMAVQGHAAQQPATFDGYSKNLPFIVRHHSRVVQGVRAGPVSDADVRNGSERSEISGGYLWRWVLWRLTWTGHMVDCVILRSWYVQ
jgi:hypothetical protein